MKKRYLLIGGLMVLGVTASALALAACDTKVPEEEVPAVTERIRYTDKTNPYAEVEWQDIAGLEDWGEKMKTAPIYYQFEGSYSEAYQGDYSRNFLYMNCYEDGSLHATYGGNENYYGFWTNVDKRGKETLVLHILNYNGKEYNSGIYESVCDAKSDEYYEYASTVVWAPSWGTRTVMINGYHYSPVKSLKVTTTEQNTNFILNDGFSTKGLVVNVERENGKSIAIDEQSFGKSDCRVQFSGFDGSEEGDKEITVKYIYTDIETKYSVNVMGITGIEIDASKGKTSYHVGDSIDKTGLKITATRKDNKKVDVSSDSNRCEYLGFDASAATDKQTITVKLDGEYEATYDISVIGIKSLAIDAKDVKKEFFVGDKLDTENLIVKATFLDNETDDIELKRCEFEGFDSGSAVESQTVKVKFQGLEQTYDVKIVAPVFSGTAKYGDKTGEVKIKIVTPDECEFTYDGKTVDLNYRTRNIAGKTVYNIILPEGSDLTEEAFNSLHKNYILDKADFSLAMATVYEIPSSGDGDTPGTPRYENEPHYIGGGTEQRFILIDEKENTATITYKYWYAGQTDTFVCRYTIEGDTLTLTELVSSQLGWGGASFGGLHKTWTLHDDGTATRNPPRVPEE